MSAVPSDEGEPCPDCGAAVELPPVEDCSCHIAPPCSACTDNVLTCPACGWAAPTPDEEKF